MYTVKQLSELAGVSIRTLHYYDEIGLLHPSKVGTNGYRYYDDAALLRLQQILFYREIGLELMQIKDVLDLMAQDAGLPLALIHADGGAVRNTFLVQFIADMTRITLRASSLPELSALGAVFSAALGMGLYPSLEALEQIPLAFTDYTPQMDAAQAEQFYTGWKAAVQRVL